MGAIPEGQRPDYLMFMMPICAVSRPAGNSNSKGKRKGKGKGKGTKGKAKAKGKADGGKVVPPVKVEKIKAPDNSKAKEMYGLANGYLACHAFNKGGCPKSDAECKFTHLLLPQAKRDALPDKPPAKILKSKSPARDQSVKSNGSGKGGKRGKKGGKREGKKSKSASPAPKHQAATNENETFGKGGRAPLCCPEYAATGKCNYMERYKKECRRPHLNEQEWKAEYDRINKKK